MVFCETCKRDYKNIIKHNETKTHIKKISKDPTLNTLKFRKNALIQIKKIIDDNDLDVKDYKGVFEELIKKFSLASALNYFKSGYLMNFKNKFDEEEIKFINVFIANINDDIDNKKINNDQNSQNKTMDDIDTSKLQHYDKMLIELYKVLPLRLSEFIHIKVYTTRPKVMSSKSNYLILDEGKIYINRSKTRKYDEFEIKNNIIKRAEFIKNINNGVNIYELSDRSFQYLLKSINTNTQQIRKIFAQTEPDKVYASRILQHKLDTHLRTYTKIK